MFSRNRAYYLVILGVIIINSCDRTETEFDPYDYTGHLTNPYQLVMANPGDTMYFVQENRKDSLEPSKKILAYWTNDTVIRDDTFHQLMIKDLNVDIILPEKLVLLVDDAGMRRHVNGYNYGMFQMIDIKSGDTSKHYSFGVNPHWFIYWWQSPFDLVKVNSAKYGKLTCGIDSFRQDANRVKSVSFQFVHNMGLTEVNLYGIEVSVNNWKDTVKHFRLTRE